MSVLTLHFDGGCWPNPGGDPRYGWVLSMEGYTVDFGSGLSDPCYPRTNNTAEFSGLLAGLRAVSTSSVGLLNMGLDRRLSSLVIKGDSLLVVKGIKWPHILKKEHLKDLCLLCLKELKRLPGLGLTGWSIEWIPREENSEADKMAGVVLPKWCSSRSRSGR